MDYLADRTKVIDASGIRKVFALAAELKDPINFSIGQPDFDVPEPIKEAAIEAIRSGHNRYSQTAGDTQVVNMLRTRIETAYNWQNPPLMLTSGVSGGLLLAFMALVNPGDEVIVPDPYFVMYKHLVNMLGGKCVYVDTYPDFKLSAEKIEQAVTPKTKMILLNSPANPSGVVNSRAEVEQVVEVARKHNLIIISDEIYEEFNYASHFSAAQLYDRVLVLKGFSKTYAMTGWRMGYAVCHPALAPLLEKMLMIQQYTFVCAPSPFQMSLLTALDYSMDQYVATYKAKRDRMVEALAGTYEITRPEGAFYMFPKVPAQYSGGTEFVKKAIANNLLVIPGNVFSEKDTHFRISYATTDDKIERGIAILKRLAAEKP
jgi:aspartate aminotransferase